jgi:hypothetical protein
MFAPLFVLRRAIHNAHHIISAECRHQQFKDFVFFESLARAIGGTYTCKLAHNQLGHRFIQVGYSACEDNSSHYTVPNLCPLCHITLCPLSHHTVPCHCHITLCSLSHHTVLSVTSHRALCLCHITLCSLSHHTVLSVTSHCALCHITLCSLCHITQSTAHQYKSLLKSKKSFLKRSLLSTVLVQVLSLSLT